MARAGSQNAGTLFSVNLLDGFAQAIHIRNNDSTNDLYVHVENKSSNQSIHTVNDTSSGNYAIVKPLQDIVFAATDRANPIVVLQVSSSSGNVNYSWSVIEV